MRTMLPRGIPPPSSLFKRSRSPSPMESRLSVRGMSVGLRAELEQLLVAVHREVHPVVRSRVEPAARPVQLGGVDREPEDVAAAPRRAGAGRNELALDRARPDVAPVEDDVDPGAVRTE